MNLQHTCQVGKVQKREISLFASCQRGRFYAKPFCDINFVYQHLNSGWNLKNDEIFLTYLGLKLFIWCITFYHCTWWILCWLSNVFSLQNSILFILFKEKIISRKWGSKRGRFQFLGGRWMFRREMGSKRGSLPPKEGDLTCKLQSKSGNCITTHFLLQQDGITDKRTDDPIIRCPRWSGRGHKNSTMMTYSIANKGK